MVYKCGGCSNEKAVPIPETDWLEEEGGRLFKRKLGWCKNCNLVYVYEITEEEQDIPEVNAT